MGRQKRPETEDERRDRLMREIGRMGDNAQWYIQEYGQEEASELMKAKFDELHRLQKARW